MKAIKNKEELTMMLKPYLGDSHNVVYTAFKTRTPYKAFSYLTKLAETFIKQEQKQKRERQFFILKS